MSDKIKIIIAEDSKLTVVGLKTTFQQYEDIEVVATAENGKIAIELIEKHNPDIVLMDIGMPIMDGIQAVKELKKKKNATKIIMLTSHNSEQDVFEALSAGACSYCMKDIEPDMLVSAVRSTNEGASWLDPSIAKIVLTGFSSKENNVSKPEDAVLTDREIEVLKLIAKGYSNSAISETLFISLNTVKTHIKNIFQKLEVEDRTQAAMKAFENEIIGKN